MADTAVAVAMDTALDPSPKPTSSDYANVSLNKMFLYTGELKPFIEKYIIDLNQEILIEDKKQFLKHIYAERSNSGIDIKHDFETVNNVNITDLAIDDELMRAIGTDQNIKNALYCLAYADYIHTTSDSVNTLFLNPFFFPFHRAFVLSDGLHDAKPRGKQITSKFWNLFKKNNNYRNQKDLNDAIVKTSIKPPKKWCDTMSEKYIDKWVDLSPDNGHALIQPIVGSERKIANVLIPPRSKKYAHIIDFKNREEKNLPLIFTVGDSAKLERYADKNKDALPNKVYDDEKANEENGDNADEEEKEEEEEGEEGEGEGESKTKINMARFNKDLSEQLTTIYDFGRNAEKNTFAVFDCPGPSIEQFSSILNADGHVTSIVSGTLDSSVSKNEGGLRNHLFTILDTVKYDKASSLCILLPEASIAEGDDSITEIMQKIVIGSVRNGNEERNIEMFFEKWTAPNQIGCPIKDTPINSASVILRNDDKCPSVNDTIRYIFSNYGVKSSSVFKSGVCCLFRYRGARGTLEADAKTNDYLDKYNDAFKQLLKPNKEDEMNQLGGCLFRVKTMGDFYRLSDTALIQYLLNDKKGQAILGTCDSYNAINSYASNNLWTIYGMPHHRFECYGPQINMTEEEKRLNEEAKKIGALKKKVIIAKDVAKDLSAKLNNSKWTDNEGVEHDESLLHKLNDGRSKISKSIGYLNIFVGGYTIEKLNKILGDTNDFSELINKVFNEANITAIDKKLDASATGSKRDSVKARFNKTLNDNIQQLNILVKKLKMNAMNKMYTLLTLLLLSKISNKIKELYTPDDYSKLLAIDTFDEQALKTYLDYTTKHQLNVDLLIKLNNKQLHDTLKDLSDKFINKQNDTPFYNNEPNLFVKGYKNSDYIKPVDETLTDKIFTKDVIFMLKPTVDDTKLVNLLFSIVDSDTNDISSIFEKTYKMYSDIVLVLNEPWVGPKLTDNLKTTDIAKLYIVDNNISTVTHISTIQTNIIEFINGLLGIVEMDMEVGGGNQTGGGDVITLEMMNSIGNSMNNIKKIIFGSDEAREMAYVELKSDESNEESNEEFCNNLTTMLIDFVIVIHDDTNYKNFQTNKSFISRHYFNIIEIVEYIINENLDDTEESRTAQGELSAALNNLNSAFINININAINTTNPQFVPISKEVKFTKDEIIAYHLNDLYQDFIENGIFIKNYDKDGICKTQTFIFFNKRTNDVRMIELTNESLEFPQYINTLLEGTLGEGPSPLVTIMDKSIIDKLPLNEYEIREILSRIDSSKRSIPVEKRKTSLGPDNPNKSARPSIGYPSYSATSGLSPSRLTGHAKQHHQPFPGFPGLLRRESSGSELSDSENPPDSRRIKRKKTRARASGLAGIIEERKSESASGHKGRSSGHTHRSSGHSRLPVHSGNKSKQPRKGGGKLKQTRKYITKHNKYTRKLNKNKSKNKSKKSNNKTKHNKRRIRKYTIKH